MGQCRVEHLQNQVQREWITGNTDMQARFVHLGRFGLLYGPCTGKCVPYILVIILALGVFTGSYDAATDISEMCDLYFVKLCPLSKWLFPVNLGRIGMFL